MTKCSLQLIYIYTFYYLNALWIIHDWCVWTEWINSQIPSDVHKYLSLRFDVFRLEHFIFLIHEWKINTLLLNNCIYNFSNYPNPITIIQRTWFPRSVECVHIINCTNISAILYIRYCTTAMFWLYIVCAVKIFEIVNALASNIFNRVYTHTHTLTHLNTRINFY